VFSEPPVLTIKEGRTHCEACGAALAPDVMHKCAGNEEYKPLAAAGMSIPEYVRQNPAYGAETVLEVHKDVVSEQAKYEEMWQHPEYRQVIPGEHCAQKFLKFANPPNNAEVIDFGCGTGGGGAAISLMATFAGKLVKVHLLDFARNCLDPEVREALTTQSHALRFDQHDLTVPLPGEWSAPYGFCTDVMEHIPPQDVDRVLINILQAAQHVFFQISCVEDACGVLIGHKLHLSVHPPAWWKAKLVALGCQIHNWEEAPDGSALIAYVTAWSTGQDLVDSGELNTEQDQIRANVRANIRAGWQQVRPYEPNDAEVMLVGGGPSLLSQLPTIVQMRQAGAKLVTLNGAYNWALEHGLKVSAQVVVDARPFNARFTHPVQEETLYLVGSQCDPLTLEGLPKERTYLWHTTAEIVRDILQEECPDKWFGVPGGCTVLLRAIPLLRMLGYRKFHLFGCDSCVNVIDALNTIRLNAPVVEHHAYAQPENEGMPLFPVTVGGRVFQCQAWQIAQAQEFVSLIKVMGDMFELEVHGGGLLEWILQHGAQMDRDREEAEEAQQQ